MHTDREFPTENLVFVRNWIDIRSPATIWGILFVSFLRALVTDGSQEIPDRAKIDRELRGWSDKGENAPSIVWGGDLEIGDYEAQCLTANAARFQCIAFGGCRD